MYHIYILYSESKNKYYVGYTSDSLEERIRRHNTHHRGFTGKTGDWKLMYTEKFEKKETAMEREKAIKAWKSKKMIEKLIGSSV